jgi:small subunit ribosomal protein S6e
MKLNISNPSSGFQKIIDVEDENILRIFYDKKIFSEGIGTPLGPEWKNYIFKITGGQDKQGFPMKNGIFTSKRVKLLLKKGSIGCRGFGMKKGERCRKSVRGCIVSPEISVLNLKIKKKGENPNEFTNEKEKKFLFPKRSSKLRKFFSINKGDGISKFMFDYMDNSQKKNKKTPKIQRLITPNSIQKKRFNIKSKKERILSSKNNLKEFGKLLYRKI